MRCIELNDEGLVKWKSDNFQFSVKGSYKMLIGEEGNQPWSEVVWTKLSAPKHSFCAWLAIQDKLRTKDKLIWERNMDKSCSWCFQNEESNSHIFFQCRNMQVIKPLMQTLGKHFNGNSWEEFISWRSSMTWRINEAEMCSFMTNAAIYETWRARNSLIFKGEARNSNEVMADVWRLIWLKIAALEQLPKWRNLKDIFAHRDLSLYF